ncbi:hypothetical protein [Streptomyces sp. NPDC058964]|uniref:hypothetical protein n=1 Tax=Streptomyces sp. NPDC058964 TaxID=3346681 RepID=UPI0036B003FF
MYTLAKRSAVKARTQAINQLKAVLVSAAPNLREEPAGLGNADLFRTCARLADDSKDDEDGDEAVPRATRITLCLPAQRIGQPPSRSRTWKDAWPGSWNTTLRRCSRWRVPVRTRPSLR